MQASFRVVTALDDYPVAHLQVVRLAADFLDHTHRLVPEDVARTNERAKHMVGERAQRVETALEGRGSCLLVRVRGHQVASRSMINGAASSIRWSATTSESTVLR